MTFVAGARFCCKQCFPVFHRNNSYCEKRNNPRCEKLRRSRRIHLSYALRERLAVTDIYVMRT